MIFYIAVVVVLVGTNLRSGRWKKKGAKFKKHVVEFQEGGGATNKIVSATNTTGSEELNSIVEV